MWLLVQETSGQALPSWRLESQMRHSEYAVESAEQLGMHEADRVPGVSTIRPGRIPSNDAVAEEECAAW